MRYLISFILGILVIFSVIAFFLKPQSTTSGKIALRWANYPSPEREVQIAEFNKRFPQYFVITDPTKSLQKVILQCSSGVGPDLFDGYGCQLSVDSGIAWDITELAEKNGFSKDNLWPSIMNDVCYKNISSEVRQYAYPASVNAPILIFNKNIFDQHGVPYPTSNMDWNEFVEIAKKVTFINQNSSLSVYGVTGTTWFIFFESQHGEYISEDGTRLLINDKKMQNAFQMYHDFLYQYHVTPRATDLQTMNTQGGWGGTPLHLFQEEKLSMTIMAKQGLISLRIAYKHQQEALKKWEKDPHRDPKKRPILLRVGSVILPHFPNQPPCCRPKSRDVLINAQSPNREQSTHFLQYLSGPEYSKIINETADSLPPNPKYAMLGVKELFPDLSEMEIHLNSIEAIKSGYTPRKSLFIPTAEIERVLIEQVSRMEADPDLKITDLLENAEQELERIMQRNLDRSPNNMKLYQKLTGSTSVSEVHRRTAL
jgi:ABC-type glycerol-3-phosphate transport system substrate-binding protein